MIAFATMPFTFEGKRRAAQARDALARCTKHRRRGLLRERSHGRHGRAQSWYPSGLCGRRHDDQPKFAFDCKFDPAAGDHAASASMICSRPCAAGVDVASLVLANPIPTIARTMRPTQALKNPVDGSRTDACRRRAMCLCKSPADQA